MSKFLEWLGGSGTGLVGGLIGNITQAITARKNRQMQQAENEKDRQFNAEEAQKQRDFEEKMYKEHESPTAQAREREQAGLSPLEGVSSQPVGGGSSASASSSTLPAAPSPDMSWLTNMGETVANIRKTNAETKMIDQQRLTEFYETAKAAFEADPTRMQQTYDEQLAKLKAEKEAKILSNREYKARVEMLEAAKDKGINIYEDNHRLNEAQIKELQARASKLSIEEAGEKIKNGISAIEFFIKQKYGASRERAEIANLNADTRHINQIVSEMEKTEEVRISLQNVQVGFARLAMNEAERNDAVGKIRSEADKAIANQLLNAVSEGGLKSMLVQMFLHDPVGTANVVQQLVPNVSYVKTSKN